MSQLKIKDGNDWISVAANGIGVPIGGNAGDILVKSSASDYATSWQASGMPKTASITIPYADWTGNGPYTQTIAISGATITSNTKVDLQMDATALTQMISDGVTAMFVSNTSGTLTLYAIGAATTVDITVQVTYYETA